MNILPYIQLMRLNKPIGIFLLWYPTAWAFWLASGGNPNPELLGWFFLGTVIMRSAGCVINDYFDRNLDKKVFRTQSRPLAMNAIKKEHALVTAFFLLGLASLILLKLPIICFYYALLAVFLSGIYPLCKRFIQSPQLILGLAFSMGIPMAYAAVGQPFDMNLVMLFIINFLWIIAYDTIYAIADKSDDIPAGIKSTAVLFGNYDTWAVALFQSISHGIWIIWAMYNHINPWFYAFWMIGFLNLFWQQYLIRGRDPVQCIRAFRSNNFYGACMWLGIIIGLMNWS